MSNTNRPNSMRARQLRPLPSVFQISVLEAPKTHKGSNGQMEDEEEDVDFSSLFKESLLLGNQKGSKATNMKGESSSSSLDQQLFLHHRILPENHLVSAENMERIWFSPDGRYGFVTQKAGELLVLDLTRNTQRLLKDSNPSEERAMHIQDFVFVNSTTIICYDARRRDQLCVIRLDFERRIFTRTVFDFGYTAIQTKRPLAFVLTEITGHDVEVRRAVLNASGTEILLFLRFDLDKMQVKVRDVDLTLVLDYHLPNCCLDPSGQSVYVMNHLKPDEMQVYDIEKKKWSRIEIGGLNMQKITGPKTNFKNFFVREMQPGTPERLFRCNLERNEWEEVPIRVDRIDDISPIIDPQSGEEDGLLIVRRFPIAMPGRAQIKYKKMEIYRVMFRRPDQLRLCAMKVMRKEFTLFAGEHNFYSVMNQVPYNRVLASAYPQMEPIPVQIFSNSSFLFGYATPL